MSNRLHPWRLAIDNRIRIDQPRDVLFWAGRWGLTDQELRDAVAAAGTSAADVAAYLGEKLDA